MNTSDIELIDSLIEGHTDYFNYEILLEAWCRIKKELVENQKPCNHSVAYPTENLNEYKCHYCEEIFTVVPKSKCPHSHYHVENLTSGSICDDCGEEI